MNILIEKRLTGKYYAWVEGRSDVKGEGKEIEQAIGNLIMRHKEFFGIENIFY